MSWTSIMQSVEKNIEKRNRTYQKLIEKINKKIFGGKKNGGKERPAAEQG